MSINNWLLSALSAAFVCCLLTIGAGAQNAPSLPVLASCGSASYVSGNLGYMTLLPGGQTCISGSISGTVTANQGGNWNIGGFDAIITNAPTVTASSYTANNAIGGLQTVAVFRNSAQPSGILNYVEMASKSGITASEVIYGFTRSPASTCTDKTAFSFSNTDLPFLIPGFPITLTPAALNGTTQTIASQSLVTSVKNNDTSLGTNLYFCAVTTGTPSPGSTSDLEFYYSLVQD